MTKTVLTIALTFAGLITLSQNNLTVHITGNEQGKGTISMGLFKRDGNFPQEGKAFKDIVRQIQKNDTAFTFNNLSEGTYAVAVFIDLNENGKLDRNFFGVPSEPFGFSNNVTGTFGPPDFEEASFHLKGNKTINITLK